MLSREEVDAVIGALPHPYQLAVQLLYGCGLLGHSDLRTTMIYTHTVQSRTLKKAESPLDLDPELVRFDDGERDGRKPGTIRTRK